MFKSSAVLCCVLLYVKTYNKTQLKVNDLANRLTVTYQDKAMTADARSKFYLQRLNQTLNCQIYKITTSDESAPGTRAAPHHFCACANIFPVYSYQKTNKTKDDIDIRQYKRYNQPPKIYDTFVIKAKKCI